MEKESPATAQPHADLVERFKHDLLASIDKADLGDRCRTLDGVDIPGCYGAAVYGPYACTCHPPSIESLQDLLEAITHAVPKLVLDLIKEADNAEV